jgi:hypothetical protein
MEITRMNPEGPAAPDAPEPSLSLMSRTVAIFTNPAGAWVGLRRRSQWWFPLVLMTVVSVAITALLHERAVLPMVVGQWEQAVEDGHMTPAQVDQAEAFMRGPTGVVMTAVPQVVAWPIVVLLMAAGIAFGVSFILGTKLPFGQAFAIMSWSSLVMLPASLLFAVLAWAKETMQGIHLGLGLLVPMSDPPAKWQMGLASFLDTFGPFEAWTLAVVVIGVHALTGVPRKSAAWVLGGLFVALRALMAALQAAFGPGV